MGFTEEPLDGRTVQVRAYLDVLTQTPAFASSARRVQLLRYLVERALAGQGEQVTEYAIGVDVFGKPASFDPRIESVVRTETGRLRQKLREYYAAAGQHDPFTIELMARSYVPRVEARSVEATPQAEETAAPRRAGWPSKTAALAAVLSAVTFASGAWLTLRRTPAPAVPASLSVAVLPFSNLTGDARQDYFSQGITEEVIAELSQAPQLRVAARTSVFQFLGKNLDARDAGRRLNVAAVLEGSVRSVTGGVRIALELIDCRTGYTLWADALDYPAQNAALIQRFIARAVLSALLPRAQAAPNVAERTSNAAAYNDYLQGLYFCNKRDRDSLVKSIAWFRASAAADPRFPRAWAGLAEAHLLLYGWAYELPAGDSAKATVSEADRALSLDPQCADALLSRAMMRALYDLNWAEAERGFQRAIRAQPGFARAHQWYATALASRGRFREASSEISRALELDPLSLAVLDTAASIDLYAGDPDSAADKIGRMEALDPQFHRIQWLRQGVDALRRRSRGEPLPGLDTAARIAAERARLTAASAAYRSGMAGANPLGMAYAWDGVGDDARTLEWLERSITDHDGGALWLAVDWNLDHVRKDARFAALLRRYGIDEGLRAH